MQNAFGLYMGKQGKMGSEGATQSRHNIVCVRYSRGCIFGFYLTRNSLGFILFL